MVLEASAVSRATHIVTTRGAAKGMDFRLTSG